MKVGLEQYKKYHADKDYTSIGLFKKLNEIYKTYKVLYPGSHVHITPSLIFPDVTYVDSFRNTAKFYEAEDVKEFISKHKEYDNEAKIKFYQQDYNKDLPESETQFDLVISQYAGFVGQATKKYLKQNGLLVCNNSHGDASMAFLDPDYELVAVYNRKCDENFTISGKSLDQYFIPKKGEHPTKETIIKSMKGVGYTKSPSGYIFRKKSK